MGSLNSTLTVPLVRTLPASRHHEGVRVGCPESFDELGADAQTVAVQCARTARARPRVSAKLHERVPQRDCEVLQGLLVCSGGALPCCDVNRWLKEEAGTTQDADWWLRAADAAVSVCHPQG